VGKIVKEMVEELDKNFEYIDYEKKGKTVIIKLEGKKMFCKNPKCDKKTFVERFECTTERGRKTKQLEEKITEISKHTSSITAAEILKGMGIEVGKSTICLRFKKK
jgi:hypothetical protein